MKYQSDLNRKSVNVVLRYCQEIEAILGIRFAAKGSTLKAKINFDRGRLPNDLKQKIIRIMQLGERAMIDSQFKINDFDNFSQKCDAVVQELNTLADKFYANPFKYNLFYLIKKIWFGLLLFWSVSLFAHLTIASSPALASGYKGIFWASLGLSTGAALLLGLLLKSKRYHQQKLDRALQNLLILIIILNPLTLSLVAVILFLYNTIMPQ
jgi:hypothetical protein